MNKPHLPEPDERLTAYLDGQLDDRERAEVERLLELHPGWRRELAELERLTRQVAAVPRCEPPGDLVARTVQRIDQEPWSVRAAGGGWATGRRLKRVAGVLVGLAAVVALVLVLPSLLHNRQISRVGQAPEEVRLGREELAEDASSAQEAEQLELREPEMPAGAPPAGIPDTGTGVERQRVVESNRVQGFTRQGGDVPPEDRPSRARDDFFSEAGRTGAASRQADDVSPESVQFGLGAAAGGLPPARPILLVTITLDAASTTEQMQERLAEAGWRVEPLENGGAEDNLVKVEELARRSRSPEPSGSGTQPADPRLAFGAEATGIGSFQVETTAEEAELVFGRLQSLQPEWRLERRYIEPAAADVLLDEGDAGARASLGPGEPPRPAGLALEPSVEGLGLKGRALGEPAVAEGVSPEAPPMEPDAAQEESDAAPMEPEGAPLPLAESASGRPVGGGSSADVEAGLAGAPGAGAGPLRVVIVVRRAGK